MPLLIYASIPGFLLWGFPLLIKPLQKMYATPQTHATPISTSPKTYFRVKMLKGKVTSIPTLHSYIVPLTHVVLFLLDFDQEVVIAKGDMHF